MKPKKKLSKQRAWQLRQVAAGKCSTCGKRREKGLAAECRLCSDKRLERRRLNRLARYRELMRAD